LIAASIIRERVGQFAIRIDSTTTFFVSFLEPSFNHAGNLIAATHPTNMRTFVAVK
jgi:hypothetical protein